MATSFIDNPLLRASEQALQSSTNQKSRLEAKAFGQALGREEADRMREERARARDYEMAFKFITEGRGTIIGGMGLDMLEKATGKTFPLLRQNNEAAIKAATHVRKFAEGADEELGMKAWQQFEATYGVTKESAKSREILKEDLRIPRIEEEAAARARGTKAGGGGSSTASDKFDEWTAARDKAGLETTDKEIEGYFRKGGKTYLEKYNEWKETFKVATGEEPGVEAVRQFLIRDPFGVFSGGSAAPVNAEDYLKGAGVD